MPGKTPLLYSKSRLISLVYSLVFFFLTIYRIRLLFNSAYNIFNIYEKISSLNSGLALTLKLTDLSFYRSVRQVLVQVKAIKAVFSILFRLIGFYIVFKR